MNQTKRGQKSGQAKSKDEFTEACETVIEFYINNPAEIGYNKLFQSLCGIRYTELIWLDKKYPAVKKTLRKELNQLWRERVSENALTGDYNPTMSKWLLQCGKMYQDEESRGMLTEYETQTLKNQSKELDLIEQDIEINIK